MSMKDPNTRHSKNILKEYGKFQIDQAKSFIKSWNKNTRIKLMVTDLLQHQKVAYQPVLCPSRRRNVTNSIITTAYENHIQILI